MLLTTAKIQRSKRDWQYIVIHHSWSPDNQVTSDWEGIKRYHTEELGWSDIGYHFGVELINSVPVLRFGRSLEETGAHCLGFNEKAIGICLIGNYDAEIPTVGQLATLEELCRELMVMYNITSKYILGHRETYALLDKPQAKSCPGILFPLNDFRDKMLLNGFIS